MKGALIVIDMQNDFMPGGALAISNADRIIPLINQLMEKFEHVIATMDWHPADHVSFATWPQHCLEESEGVSLVKELHQEQIEKIFRKGMDPMVDSYSAFFDTNLADYLKKKKIQDLYFVGVATDFCVFHSLLDALELGFSATLVLDACMPIDSEGGEKAVAEMREKGARIWLSKQLFDG